MFKLKHLKTLQHVSILFRSSSGSSCSLLKLLILKFVKNVKVNVVNAFCVKMCAGLQSGTHLHTELTYTHQMLFCRITTLTFTFLKNFKISNFNKEHMSSLKMI